MTTEEQEIINRANGRLPDILGAQTVNQGDGLGAPQPRRKRSDAGKPRAKAGDAIQVPCGAINEHQANTIERLCEELEEATFRLRDAEGKHRLAHAKFHDYVQSLRGPA